MTRRAACLLIVLLVVARAFVLCPDCNELNRETLGPCVCGECHEGYVTLWGWDGSASKCHNIGTCNGETYYNISTEQCRSCYNGFTNSMCLPCRPSDELAVSCTTCLRSEWYDDGTCVTRSTVPTNDIQTAPSGPEGDTVTSSVSDLCGDNQLPTENWQTWLTYVARCTTDVGVCVPTPSGQCWTDPSSNILEAVYQIAQRCGPGHYVRPFIAVNTVPCAMVECPFGSLDHDQDPLTPCRKDGTPPDIVEVDVNNTKCRPSEGSVCPIGNIFADLVRKSGLDFVVISDAQNVLVTSADITVSMHIGERDGDTALLDSTMADLVSAATLEDIHSTSMDWHYKELSRVDDLDSVCKEIVEGGSPEADFPIISQGYKLTCYEDGIHGGGSPEAKIKRLNSAGNWEYLSHTESINALAYSTQAVTTWTQRDPVPGGSTGPAPTIREDIEITLRTSVNYFYVESEEEA